VGGKAEIVHLRKMGTSGTYTLGNARSINITERLKKRLKN
jgi:hypothetical protein